MTKAEKRDAVLNLLRSFRQVNLEELEKAADAIGVKREDFLECFEKLKSSYLVRSDDALEYQLTDWGENFKGFVAAKDAKKRRLKRPLFRDNAIVTTSLIICAFGLILGITATYQMLASYEKDKRIDMLEGELKHCRTQQLAVPIN